MILKNYRSIRGVHCASNALTEIHNYYNPDNEITESIVFGLGEGISFNYAPLNQQRPRVLNFRNPFLENIFLNKTNINLKWRYSKELPINNLKKYLDQQIPILLHTDTRYLPFLNFSDPSTLGNVGAHTVVLIGYNKDTYYLSDYISSDILEISKDELIMATSQTKPPFFKKNLWMPVGRFQINDLETKIIDSILMNSQYMLNYNSYTGISSINKLMTEILYWPKFPYWKEVAFNAYMAIEKVGSGGGGFRYLYADFLQEVMKIHPEVQNEKFISDLRQIAKSYSKIAKLFFRVYRKGDIDLLKQIKIQLFELKKNEKNFWLSLEKVTKSKFHILS